MTATSGRARPRFPAPARRLGPRRRPAEHLHARLAQRAEDQDQHGGPVRALAAADHVPGPVHLRFGGAIAGGTHQYLQFSLPGILVLSVVFATLGTGMMLSQDITTGVFDRFRSLPIVRWAPLAGAILGDLVRYMMSMLVTLGFGMSSGSGSDQRARRRHGLPAARGVRLRDVLAVGHARRAGEVRAGRAVSGFLFMFPLVFGSNILMSTARCRAGCRPSSRSTR